MICETLKVFKTFRVCVPGEIIQTGGDTATGKETCHPSRGSFHFGYCLSYDPATRTLS